MTLPTPPKRPESVLVKELVRALRMIGCVAWRNNRRVLTLPGRGGRDRLVTFGGPQGASDVLGIVPVRCPVRVIEGERCWKSCPGCEGRQQIGLTLAVEVKQPDEEPSPTQKAFLAMVNAAGGLGLVARSVDDVIPLVLRRMGQR